MLVSVVFSFDSYNLPRKIPLESRKSTFPAFSAFLAILPDLSNEYLNIAVSANSMISDLLGIQTTKVSDKITVESISKENEKENDVI